MVASVPNGVGLGGCLAPHPGFVSDQLCDVGDLFYFFFTAQCPKPSSAEWEQ